ncbi:sodium-coupled monocarboxylate transporter 2-like [Tropilaelaps mercedesae]|uniref:Sodium-coupled monocarboxylate transporter 2-like n=1 Tax=Tropilaelaps mercedesae TaxID=418985 RepID=A0A1V9X466_9ACAR|nr:sodium-coupled monocarboxylate transporter 2-like [Tropilaelaps mercedesae]
MLIAHGPSCPRVNIATLLCRYDSKNEANEQQPLTRLATLRRAIFAYCPSAMRVHTSGYFVRSSCERSEINLGGCWTRLISLGSPHLCLVYGEDAVHEHWPIFATVFPVTMSMMATFLSAIAFLGIPAENFVFGFQYILVAAGAMLGVFIATEFFMPIFYDMDAVSVNAVSTNDRVALSEYDLRVCQRTPY